MKISPNYTCENWKELSFSTEEDWKKAIDIFKDRINGRFFNIIKEIENHEFSGFAILALDCLLIETLQQYREGQNQTPRGRSEDYFIKFLTETSFKNFFTKEAASIFYDHFRCGILHQAELKEKSKVRIGKNVPLVKVIYNGEGLLVNRRLFHEQLLKVFEEYIFELMDSTKKELRNKFKRKMDYICRLDSK